MSREIARASARGPVLRVGTRGSELALRQTRWVVARLSRLYPELAVEEVVIRTHGDVAVQDRFDIHWPAGGFVGAIEQALAAGDIDFAVHSFKDLPTAATPGLVVAAVPPREAAHDVLVTRVPVDLNRLGPGFRVGTSSPRRAAQFRRLGDVTVVAIRGNVPTRIAKLEQGDLDGVVLAAAGIRRLDLEPAHRLDLPTERFVPSPAQGALAVQARENSPAAELLEALNDPAARETVDAERSFLSAIHAGCHVPVGALAILGDRDLTLRGQIFKEDESGVAEGTETGADPQALGRRLAETLLGELRGGP